MNPALGVVSQTLCFFGREAMVRAEVLDEVPFFRRSEFNAGQKNHALKRQFPTFRSSALPGNALHVSAIVAGVAASAFRFHQWIRDRAAFLTRGLRLAGNKVQKQKGPQQRACKKNNAPKSRGAPKW